MTPRLQLKIHHPDGSKSVLRIQFQSQLVAIGNTPECRVKLNLPHTKTILYRLHVPHHPHLMIRLEGNKIPFEINQCFTHDSFFKPPALIRIGDHHLQITKVIQKSKTTHLPMSDNSNLSFVNSISSYFYRYRNPNRKIPTLEDVEKELLIEALHFCDGNRKKAAKLIGIGRSTLFEKIKRHEIFRPKLARDSNQLKF